MEIANHRFKVGQRVKMTELAIERGLDRARKGRVVTGTVTGFCANPYMIRVRRDGLKFPTAWHIEFWRTTRERHGKVNIPASDEGGI